MSIKGYKIPIISGTLVPKEIKRVKILTGKYRGKIKDFCYFLECGERVVVNVDSCKRFTYKISSVEFVESDYVLVQEVLR